MACCKEWKANSRQCQIPCGWYVVINIKWSMYWNKFEEKCLRGNLITVSSTRANGDWLCVFTKGICHLSILELDTRQWQTYHIFLASYLMFSPFLICTLPDIYLIVFLGHYLKLDLES